VHADHGRVEQWHPRPEAILETGPVIDIGLYPLALLTVLHGPVRKVRAVGARLLTTRRSRTRSFTTDRDDFVAASLTFADGALALAQLTCNFYVDGSRSGGEALEFHGDEESLYVASWAATNAAVWTVDQNGVAHQLMTDPAGDAAIDWSLGIGDLVDAVVSNREPHTSPEHAVHVLQVAEAIARSSSTERTVQLSSDFPIPPPPLSGLGVVSETPMMKDAT
jgi:predicted dehydrogenase